MDCASESGEIHIAKSNKDLGCASPDGLHSTGMLARQCGSRALAAPICAWIEPNWAYTMLGTPPSGVDRGRRRMSLAFCREILDREQMPFRLPSGVVVHPWQFEGLADCMLILPNGRVEPLAAALLDAAEDGTILLWSGCSPAIQVDVPGEPRLYVVSSRANVPYGVAEKSIL